MSIPLKIIIADDNEIYRDGFQIMLKKQNDLELVGKAENGKELLDMVPAMKPDIIITDIKMPVMDGIEATKRITKLYPYIGVIALSMFNEENLIVDMLEAGAKGYLLKNTTKEEVIEAARAVYRDETYYCPDTTTKLAKLIARSNFNPYNKLKPQLNNKELEVIRLICLELSNKEIADRMHQSVRTIEGYRKQILEKIQAKNTAGIVVFAIKHNLHEVN
jgi:DNA-binding NarL/FixJ family response regulator